MATIQCVIAESHVFTRTGRPLGIPSSRPLAKERLTSAVTNVVSTISVADPNKRGGTHRFWSVTVLGGNVWVDFGSAPDAVTNKTWLVLDGQTREFGCYHDGTLGDKIAIADAP